MENHSLHGCLLVQAWFPIDEYPPVSRVNKKAAFVQMRLQHFDLTPDYGPEIPDGLLIFAGRRIVEKKGDEACGVIQNEIVALMWMRQFIHTGRDDSLLIDQSGKKIETSFCQIEVTKCDMVYGSTHC